MDHIDICKQLLRDDSRTMQEIAKAAGVSRQWLTLFKAGKVPNPGYRTIEALYAVLNNSQERAA